MSKTDPTFVASYRILGILGGGGMGRVYLGQSRGGRRLAIKVLNEQFADDPEYRERFAREVAAARSVSPLYTAAVVDADPRAKAPWLATTYIDGPSLQQWVDKHGPLPPATVLTLAAGLAEALASIHQVGLVHRDLKPANVLIDSNGPHIIDFGIALSGEDTRITTSVLMGTPSYLAPERIDGSDLDPSSDIFSLGATLFYAATGNALIKEGTFYQQITQIATGRFDLTEVPLECRPVVVRCLGQQPKDRPTALELAQILAGLGVSQPAEGWWVQTPDESDVDTGSHPRKRTTKELDHASPSRRKFLVSGVAVGVAVVGGGVVGAMEYWRHRRAASTAHPSPSPTQVSEVSERISRVAWQASSGAGGKSGGPGDRVIVYRGTRIVAASVSDVLGTDPLGTRVWTQHVNSSQVALWPWGDEVVAADKRGFFTVDPISGRKRLEIDVATPEEARKSDNPDRTTVQLERVLTAPSHLVLNLRTANLVLDRAGKAAWRQPRAVDPIGRRVELPENLAADFTRLVQREKGLNPRIVLRMLATGRQVWAVRDDFDPHPPEPPRGPDGGGDPGWERAEGRFAPRHLLLRAAQQLQVRTLADGKLLWQTTFSMPIAGIELASNLVLVAADKLTALELETGRQLWDVPARGSRVAVSEPEQIIYMLSEQGLSALDFTGRTLWQEPMPQVIEGMLLEKLSLDAGIAYATFRPRDDRGGQNAIDVVAFKTN